MSEYYWAMCDWTYKFNIFCDEILPKYTIPIEGQVLQLGVAYGLGLEKLSALYGKDRTLGLDIENPLRHPLCEIYDCSKPLKDRDLAFVHIDPGSVYKPEFKEMRINLIKWATSNILKDGILITAGRNRAKKCLSWDVEKHLKNNNFEIAHPEDHLSQDSINLLKETKQGVEDQIIAIKR